MFPIHPRTKAKADIDNIKLEKFNNITFIDPLGYIESLPFQKYADCIFTDSGGIQKEAYMLKKKCITLSPETEWAETLENKWNHLVFEDLNLINEYIQVKPGEHISQLYGNGNAAIEIVDILRQYF